MEHDYNLIIEQLLKVLDTKDKVHDISQSWDIDSEHKITIKIEKIEIEND